MKRKGIVVEFKKNDYTVVITRQGEWIELPYQEGVLEGEEITFQVPVKKSWWKSGKVMPLLSAAAAACLAGVLFFSPWFASDTHASTYISVESQNSYVELGISSERQVVNIQTDSSSKNVIQHMNDDWKNEKLDAFVIEYLQTARKQGVLKSKDRVIVAEKNVSVTCTKWIKELPKKIKKDPALKSVELYVLPIPPKVYQQAKMEGMPPAKYVILIVARKEKIPIAVLDEINVDIEPLLELEPIKQLLAQPPESEAEWMALLSETPSEGETVISAENETESESEEITIDSPSSSESSSFTTTNSSSESASSATSTTTTSDSANDSSTGSSDTKSTSPSSPSTSPDDGSKQEPKSDKEETKTEVNDPSSGEGPKQEPSKPPAKDGNNNPTNEEPTQPSESAPDKPSQDPSETPSDESGNKEEHAPSEPGPSKEDPVNLTVEFLFSCLQK